MLACVRAVLALQAVDLSVLESSRIWEQITDCNSPVSWAVCGFGADTKTVEVQARCRLMSLPPVSTAVAVAWAWSSRLLCCCRHGFEPAVVVVDCPRCSPLSSRTRCSLPAFE